MEQIENRIKELLNEKEWTFADLQNMEGIVEKFTDILEEELDYGFIARLCEGFPIVEIVKETRGDGEPLYQTFGELFWFVRQNTLKQWVARYLKEELLNANVNFNGEDKNEISERSVAGKPQKGSDSISEGNKEK